MMSAVISGRRRVLLGYARDAVDGWPEPARAEGLDLIDRGQFRVRNVIIEDAQSRHDGMNFIVDLLADDGRVIPVDPMVHWSALAVPAQDEFMEILEGGPPD